MCMCFLTFFIVFPSTEIFTFKYILLLHSRKSWSTPSEAYLISLAMQFIDMIEEKIANLNRLISDLLISFQKRIKKLSND